jgi:mRNA-degrading endonuclease toxin of MazEF toxin-antitoxin module
LSVPFQTPERGWLVGITPKEQDRVKVPKSRPWLILQTSACRDGHPDRTVLACYLTDTRDANSNLKWERCGDVLVQAVWSGAVKKDSLVRLGTIQPIRESEISDHYGILSPAEMLSVDKELRDLLFDEDNILFAETSSAQPEAKPASAPIIIGKPASEPFLGKSHKPIRKLPSQPQLGKRKKDRNVEAKLPKILQNNL